MTHKFEFIEAEDEIDALIVAKYGSSDTSKIYPLVFSFQLTELLKRVYALDFRGGFEGILPGLVEWSTMSKIIQVPTPTTHDLQDFKENVIKRVRKVIFDHDIVVEYDTQKRQQLKDVCSTFFRSIFNDAETMVQVDRRWVRRKLTLKDVAEFLNLNVVVFSGNSVVERIHVNEKMVVCLIRKKDGKTHVVRCDGSFAARSEDVEDVLLEGRNEKNEDKGPVRLVAAGEAEVEKRKPRPPASRGRKTPEKKNDRFFSREKRQEYSPSKRRQVMVETEVKKTPLKKTEEWVKTYEKRHHISTSCLCGGGSKRSHPRRERTRDRRRRGHHEEVEENHKDTRDRRSRGHHEEVEENHKVKTTPSLPPQQPLPPPSSFSSFEPPKWFKKSDYSVLNTTEVEK
jgi:hypothetical protein